MMSGSAEGRMIRQNILRSLAPKLRPISMSDGGTDRMAVAVFTMMMKIVYMTITAIVVSRVESGTEGGEEDRREDQRRRGQQRVHVDVERSIRSLGRRPSARR